MLLKAVPVLAVYVGSIAVPLGIANKQACEKESLKTIASEMSDIEWYTFTGAEIEGNDVVANIKSELAALSWLEKSLALKEKKAIYENAKSELAKFEKLNETDKDSAKKSLQLVIDHLSSLKGDGKSGTKKLRKLTIKEFGKLAAAQEAEGKKYEFY